MVAEPGEGILQRVREVLIQRRMRAGTTTRTGDATLLIVVQRPFDPVRSRRNAVSAQGEADPFVVPAGMRLALDFGNLRRRY